MPGKKPKEAESGEATGDEGGLGELSRFFRLPSVWTEFGRGVARHWAVPVFVASVLLGLYLWVLFPDPTLVRRSAKEYYARAETARLAAFEARGDGRLSDAITHFDAVVYNLETLRSLYGFTLDTVEGEARRFAPYWLGEAYLELAALQEADPSGAGSRVRMRREELLGRGATRLEEAAYFRDELERRAALVSAAYEHEARRHPVDEKELGRLRLARGRREDLRFSEVGAQRVDLLRAEALAGADRSSEAIHILGELLARIRSVEIRALRGAKTPGPGTGEPAGLSPQDRARIHLILGESNERLGREEEAARQYERFLREGGRGPGAHRARLHLVRLYAEAGRREFAAGAGETKAAGREAACKAARSHFERARNFSAQIIASDAPGPTREEAVFTAGRMALRLAGLRDAAEVPGAGDPRRLDPAAAAHYEAAARHLGSAFTPQSGYQEQARLLQGRALLALGRLAEAEEIFESIRGTATRDTLALAARVGLADASLARGDWDEAWTRIVGKGEGRETLGYRALGRARGLWRDAATAGLAPEIVEIMHPAYLVGAGDDGIADAAGRRGRLLLLARHRHQLGRFDLAAEIYAHVLDTYAPPPDGEGGYVRRDRYLWLVAGEYGEKAAALTARRLAQERAKLSADRKLRKREAAAQLRAAHAYMRIPREASASPLVAHAYWRAALAYETAGVAEGVVLALKKFTENYGDDERDSRARHLLGTALVAVGRPDEAVTVFAGNASTYSDSYSYMSDVARGEAFLAAGRPARARETFRAILRDARYTPESHIWMRAIFGLVEASWLAARDLDGEGVLARAEAEHLEAEGKAAEAEAARARAHASREEARRLYAEVADRLAEARERFPYKRYDRSDEGHSPYFYPFLRRVWLPCAHRGALALVEIGRFDEARRLFAEIIDQKRDHDLRRSAFLHQGLSYLREVPPRPREAARVFRAGREAYPRTRGAALLGMLLGVAEGRGAPPDLAQAIDWAVQAERGFAEFPPEPTLEEMPDFQRAVPYDLRGEVWREQNAWFRKDLERRSAP